MTQQTEGMDKNFPFSAIVGQDRMKLALILNAINPAIGGVLIRGEKGTANRRRRGPPLAALLPEIGVVTGCPYSCEPDAPFAGCDFCAGERRRVRGARGRCALWSCR